MSKPFTDEEFQSARRQLRNLNEAQLLQFNARTTTDQWKSLTDAERQAIQDIQGRAAELRTFEGQEAVRARAAEEQRAGEEFNEIDTNDDGEISKREQKAWDTAQKAEDNAIKAEEKRIAEAKGKSYKSTRKNLRNKDLKDLNELERELFELYNGPNGIARLSVIRNQVRFGSEGHDEEELEKNIGKANAIAERINQLGGDSRAVIEAASRASGLESGNDHFVYQSYRQWQDSLQEARAIEESSGRSPQQDGIDAQNAAANAGFNRCLSSEMFSRPNCEPEMERTLDVETMRVLREIYTTTTTKPLSLEPKAPPPFVANDASSPRTK